jgi:hypothetical protein
VSTAARAGSGRVGLADELGGSVWCAKKRKKSGKVLLTTLRSFKGDKGRRWSSGGDIQ